MLPLLIQEFLLEVEEIQQMLVQDGEPLCFLLSLKNLIINGLGD
jgi:hypothetical protein